MLTSALNLVHIPLRECESRNVLEENPAVTGLPPLAEDGCKAQKVKTFDSWGLVLQHKSFSIFLFYLYLLTSTLLSTKMKVPTIKSEYAIAFHLYAV